jgi:deoxyhypusine synthase
MLVQRKMVDVVVTTCGTLDHDLARCWGDYMRGSFDAADEELLKVGIHRLGSVFIPLDAYGPALESRMQPFLEDMYGADGIRTISGHELLWRLGEKLADESSILYWASKNEIPIIVPGITDGAVGSQLWLFRQAHSDFQIDLLADENLLSDIVHTADRTGGIIIGGGISKHHVIWWNQFREGLDSAVYVTTAPEYDGSLSGARLREAVSWGKLRPQATRVTIPGEATVIVPVLMAALLDRLKGE